jgi:hypothetical protein
LIEKTSARFRQENIYENDNTFNFGSFNRRFFRLPDGIN